MDMEHPHIIFPDISTMDAGDIDFSPLASIGTFESFPTTPPALVATRLAVADVAIVNKVVLGAAEMDACPRLRLIQLSATGYNNIDLQAASDRGISVCNVRGYSSDSVAQHTIGLLLNLVTSIHRFANEASRWCESPIFTRLDYPISELAGKTMGIVGSGGIGTRVADIAAALGMGIQFLQRRGSATRSLPGRPRVASDEFFASSDVISLHCPLTDENRHMIDATSLARMKRSAILINTGRGDLVDEAALAQALADDQIAAAGLGVLSTEPPAADHPLIRLAQTSPGRLIITPHSAWAAVEARRRLLEGIVGNIRAWQAGQPQNLVN